MKYSIFIIPFFLVGFCLHAQHDRVLFIGNSYTSVNNLPGIIESIFQSNGEDSGEIVVSAPGGYTFQQHCSYSIPYIQQGGFKYVVLQEQSQLPSFPEAQFFEVSYPYAHQLCELIRLYNPDAKIFFYMTWGRRDGDSINCQHYPPLCTYDGMDSLLYARYMQMACDNQVSISPVGAVWHYIRDLHPDLELYQTDGSHPTYLGSYIAACCFYTLFTGHNPIEINWNGNLAQIVANKVKIAVKTVVYDSLTKWISPVCFESDSSTSSTCSPTSVSSFRLYPNPAGNHVNFDLPFAGSQYELSVMNVSGKVLYSSVNCESTGMDISFLPKGTYFVHIRQNNRLYISKLEIVH